MNFLHRTWAEISESAIIHNIKQIKARSNGAEIMAVVKANAYGHSAKIAAPILESHGADRFAVSNIEEALELRDYGIAKPILVLGYTPVSCARKLAENNISQCVYSYDYARGLSENAQNNAVSVNIHLKFDTGMSRLGFDLRDDNLAGLSEAVSAAKMANLCLEGVFTHFAAADSYARKNTDYTKAQYNRFTAGVQRLRSEGLSPKLIHCDNSAALCQGGYDGNTVRPGIILYGLSPDREFDTGLNLLPVMTVKSVVSFVKTVKKGTSISYGMTYNAEKDMKIATVAAGYADGYPRTLSNRGEVLIRGKRARILGRVCMDQFMIDVTDIENVSMGDEVILFGKDLSVEEIARLADTINYEIVCSIAPRVPRVLVD